MVLQPLRVVAQEDFAIDSIKTVFQEKSIEKSRPKVALVLSGGGAKGFAEIGVLKVLEREGIPVDIVVGTSFGSIISGLYATGYTANEIDSLCHIQNWNIILSDKVRRRYRSPNSQTIDQRFILKFPIQKKKLFSLPQSVVNGQNVINLFCSLTANVPDNADFSKDLKREFACVATDFSTGDKVVLRKGSLPYSMYASMAIPAAFEPATIDGRMLVDGGVVDNFPIDVAKEMGADIIIGVDLRDKVIERKHIKDMIDVVGQLMTLYDPMDLNKDTAICDIIIRPDLSGYNVASFTDEAVDTLIRRGEEAGLRSIDKIRELKTAYNLQPDTVDRNLVNMKKWRIENIEITGKHSLPDKTLIRRSAIKLPDSITTTQIKRGIDKIYGHYNFKKIYYNLKENDSIVGKTLVLNVDEGKSFTENVGFKANTIDAAAIMLNINLQDYTHKLGLFSATAEISANPGVSLLGELHYHRLPVIGIRIDGKMRNYRIFHNKDKLSSSYLYFAQGNVFVTRRFFDIFDTELGYRLKYYWSELFTNDKFNYNLTSNKALVGQPYLRLSIDNFDDFYFPRRGVRLFAEASITDDYINKNDFTPILQVGFKSVIPILSRKRLAFLMDFYTRMLFSTNEYPIYESTFFGGVEYAPYFDHHTQFYGLDAIYKGNDYTMMMMGGIRYRFYKRNYLTLRVNMLHTANDLFDPSNMLQVLGYALSYSMQTPLGPIDLTIGYSSHYDKPVFAANFGYWF
ncbi:MAG: patatin-like phospholipase family protein [Paludibacteraceae bacterium]|nr:patatin-like phospholipase family protein [Paludibacteraceae bacterium]